LRTGGIDAVAHLESPIGFIGDFQSYSGQHSAFSYQQIFALSPLVVLGDILTLKHSAITKAEGRRQEAVGTQFVTGIYTPLQKLFAFKSEVLDPIVLITFRIERLAMARISNLDS
jgi:hypothetical protein